MYRFMYQNDPYVLTGGHFFSGLTKLLSTLWYVRSSSNFEMAINVLSGWHIWLLLRLAAGVLGGLSAYTYA